MTALDGSFPDRDKTRDKVSLKAVALPTEHGGWSLTAEPAILGLIVAWSWSGLALALAAMLAFVTRTPVKVVLVDRHRRRWLPRTRLALVISAVEIMVLVGLAVAAWRSAEQQFWVPLAAAAPLILLELWYDMRSRSRRLLPELAGTVGIGSIAAAIGLAGGVTTSVAVGLWCVIGARSAAAIPYVRCQILRTKSHPAPFWTSDLAQIVSVIVVVVGWLLAAVPLAAVLVVACVGCLNLLALRQPPRRAVVIGIQQMVFGSLVVAVTAIAVRAG